VKKENLVESEQFDRGIGEKGPEENKNDTINWIIVY
jgi:hypothetical protein